MPKLPSWFISTCLHMTELGMVLLVVYILSTVFHVSSEQLQIIIGLILAALAKGLRAAPDSGVPEYVNPQVKTET